MSEYVVGEIDYMGDEYDMVDAEAGIDIEFYGRELDDSDYESDGNDIVVSCVLSMM